MNSENEIRSQVEGGGDSAELKIDSYFIMTGRKEDCMGKGAGCESR